jgi:F420 biosynthesis protein FbiB-like protein
MEPASGALREEESSTGGAHGGTPFWDAVRARRSVRRYSEEPVSREAIERLLEAATWAPSAHNRQPWRFCISIDVEIRRRLVAAMAERWQADLAADGLDGAEIEARTSTNRLRLTAAPVLVLASLCMEEMDSYPDVRRRDAERIMGIQSVALACQNLLLAAHVEGLGACWMCAPLFAADAVRKALELPPSWEPQALITLGHPAERRSKDRFPVASRVVWR